MTLERMERRKQRKLAKRISQNGKTACLNAFQDKKVKISHPTQVLIFICETRKKSAKIKSFRRLELRKIRRKKRKNDF